VRVDTEVDFDIGNEIYKLAKRLYPICRSITGEGVRQTHRIIGEYIPLRTHEVPTGTQVFDWTVPKEWNIRDAYVRNSHGEKIIDFQQSNLHVLSHSVPVSAKMSLNELKPHLHTLPEHPDVIPYLTTYYNEDWGFCLSHNQFLQLEEGSYEVFIDSSLTDGYLTYSECYLQGEQTEEVLISCYTCHPSLCNDNLSGVVLTTFLAKHLSSLNLKYSYRFLFIPETIGAITWLCLNKDNVSKIKYGIVSTCVGDGGNFTYKKSRQGNADIDNIVMHVLKHSNRDYKVVDFFPWGSDERQFCSPGFNLPVGSIMRTPYLKFPEYHTSADNLNFIQPQYLAESFSVYMSVINIIENNKTYVNLNPNCEPQLGRREIYSTIGGIKESQPNKEAMLWILNMSDGNHTLLDISDMSNLEFSLIKNIANLLFSHNLLKEI